MVLHQRPPDTADLLDEADRLGWLAGRGGAPDVLASGRADEGDEAVVVRLATAAVRASDPHPLGPEPLATTLGAALRRLHTVDAGTCPLDASLRAQRQRVAERYRRGAIEVAPSGPYGGRPVADLLGVLDTRLATLGEIGRRVFVHGGLRPDRIWFVPDGEVVFTGWRRGGIGDPHLDLAAACALVIGLHGPALVAPLLDAYGLDEVDVQRLDACQLLVHLLG
jgi:aminoglycoside phosphotransferase